VGAAFKAGDASSAVDTAWSLLVNDVQRQVAGQAARQWSAGHAGATARTMQALTTLLR